MAGLASALGDTGTTPVATLGKEFHEPASESSPGERTWIYVYNNSGANWPAYRAIKRDVTAAVTTYEGELTAAGTAVAPFLLLGVTQHAIADGEYGWIQKRGPATVTAGDGVALAPGLGLQAGGGATTAGTFVDVATTEDSVGVVTTTIAGGATGTAFLALP